MIYLHSLIQKKGKKSIFCFKSLAGILGESVALFVCCVISLSSFYVCKWHCFEEKSKKSIFGIVLIVGWYCYLDILVKISSIFLSQSKLLGNLRFKLGTKIWKYLLKVPTTSKSLLNILPFSITDIFSKLFDYQRKKLQFPDFFLSFMFFCVKFE